MAENITKKYRPRRFQDIIGQQAAVATVTSAITSGIIPPAYLAWGLQGSGKTTIARLIAMSLNCSNRQGHEPCGECMDCKDILRDAHPNLIELDGATNGGVENMRQLVASVRFAVSVGKYKVVIIDECHALTKQAWQAALKTIEEPPRQVMFIFCTTEYQKVLPTIKSRCVQLQFSGLTDDVVEKMLKKIVDAEACTCEDGALARIAKEAHGSVRDAQSILEAFIRTGSISVAAVTSAYQTLDPMTLVEYFNAIAAKDAKRACAITGGWIRLGNSPDSIITGALEHLKSMLMDFTITDTTLRKLVKTQRERIGDQYLYPWINFFYDQLRFLREYPMSYTLQVDLVTLALIGTLFSEPARKSVKTKKSEPDAPPPPVPAGSAAPAIGQPAPAQTQKVNQNLIARLEMVSKGSAVEVDELMQRVTMKTTAGDLFDVVVDPIYAKNSIYILDSDLQTAIKDYPQNMGAIARKRVANA